MNQPKKYSQNDEELVIKQYFFGQNPEELTVLDIGANDGITFSNSYGLIADGWNAHLLEPSAKAYSLMVSLHSENPRVKCHGYGIADFTGTAAFLESGSFENKGEDIALLSTLHEKELKRWGDKVKFEQVQAHFYTFADFMRNPLLNHNQKFDFITIDAEGSDWDILQQIDLDAVGCKMLCVEYNSLPLFRNLFTDYASKFNMKLRSFNAENLLFIK